MWIVHLLGEVSTCNLEFFYRKKIFLFVYYLHLCGLTYTCFVLWGTICTVLFILLLSSLHLWPLRALPVLLLVPCETILLRCSTLLFSELLLTFWNCKALRAPVVLFWSQPSHHPFLQRAQFTLHWNSNDPKPSSLLSYNW